LFISSKSIGLIADAVCANSSKVVKKLIVVLETERMRAEE
jgi:hypothetical protein